MKTKYIFTLLVLSLFIHSCNHGIEPPHRKTGISGTVYFTNWAAADSIYLLKIVFFKNFPPPDIANQVLTGMAATYPVSLADGLPVDEDSIHYEIQLRSGIYQYISVAQQYGDNVFQDWRSVGQYNETPGDSLPTPVTVIQDSMLQNINIYVDFNHLPVQPF